MPRTPSPQEPCSISRSTGFPCRIRFWWQARGTLRCPGSPRPPLITVHYSYERSGELAVQMLMEAINGEEGTLREIKLGYSLVDRRENGNRES